MRVALAVKHKISYRNLLTLFETGFIMQTLPRQYYRYFIILLLSVLLAACNDGQEEKTAALAQNLVKQYAEIDFVVNTINEQPYDNTPALSVNLSAPIDRNKQFQSYLKLTDAKGNLIDGSWLLSSDDKQLFFLGIEPDQDYIVTVFKGLSAITGKNLVTKVQKKIHSRHLTPFVDFASKGSLIPATLVKGLPVVSVNIDQVDVDFYRVKADKISQFLGDWRGKLSEVNAWDVRDYNYLSDLVYTSRFNLSPPKNQRYTTHLDIHSIAQLNEPGVYLAVMKVAGQYTDHQLNYFTISDIGIHTHTLSDQLNVYVSSLETGEALTDVELSFLDKLGQELAVLSSDQQGVAQLMQGQEQAKVLIATKGKHLSVLRLKRAALDLSEFKGEGSLDSPLVLFTYGPRDIYRPGETVIFNGLLRDHTGQSVANPPLKAVIKKPDGQALHYFTWQADDTGLYHETFNLPKQANTGQWTLEVTVPGANNVDYHFQVEDFLPERMALQLGAAEYSKQVLPKQALSVPVIGRYLYGAPATGNILSSQVTLKANQHPVRQYRDFYFGETDEKIPFSDYMGFSPDDLKLDAKGQGIIAVKDKWKAVQNTPVTIELVASLYETGGRAINRFIKYIYWPHESLIGVRSVLNLGDLTANSSAEFELIHIAHDGSQPAAEVLLTLTHEQREYYWEYQADGNEGWQQSYTQNNTPVFTQQISLSADTIEKLKLPLEQGQYLLKIKNIKTGQTTTLRFNAGQDWGALTEQSAKPDRVVMQWDKKSYLPGDIAQLKIIPPHQGNGFIIVENSQESLWFKRLSVPAQGLTVAIPVDESWNKHDIYASAVVFRAGNVKQKITPNRAVGLLHLPLDKTAQVLHLELTTETDKIRPESSLNTHIKLLNVQAGEEVFVTLAAVDIGVLSPTDFSTPDPLKMFLAKRRYGVDQHDVYGNIVEILEGGLRKARFGGDGYEDNGTMPRTDVKIVSLFTGPVKLNEQGEADISLDIPDFNGKLRLMALAYSGKRFGAAENYVTVAAPIIAEAALPRFLAGGDQSLLTLDILNQSGAEQTISVRLASAGPVHIDAQTQTLQLAHQQKQVLKFPLSADHAFDQADLTLHLSNNLDGEQKIELQREWHLAVRPAYPAINHVIRKQIAAKKKLTIAIPVKQFLLDSTQVKLSIAAQPPLNITEQLTELLTYPYGCLEQTTSTSYPWLFLNTQRINQFKLTETKVDGEAIDFTQRTVQINRSMMRLAGMQRGNGSFGLWDSDGEEEYWLTAYVSDFLLDAREQGFQVPEPLLNKALERLLRYVNTEGGMYREPYSSKPKHSTLAYQAYAAYVLSRVNHAPLGSLRTLFDQHKNESQSGLPLVHLGVALINQGDIKRGNQAIQQALTIKRPARLYLADYGSPLRDLSLMTYLLNKHKLSSPASEQLVFQLSGALGTRQYLSTQERNALFLTALELSGSEQKAWVAKLIVNKVTQRLEQKEPYQARLSAEEIPDKISIHSLHDKPLFMQIRIKGYPQKAPDAMMDTFKIQRHYYTLKGEAVDLTQLKVGELLLVHLKLKAKERISQALVVDLLPAGFELENQNMDNSIKLSNLDLEIDGQSVDRLLYEDSINYQEYRDDRYIVALDMYEGDVNDLFYLVRMVTPGTYTVPPVYIEDMYRPYIRGIGAANAKATIK